MVPLEDFEKRKTKKTKHLPMNPEFFEMMLKLAKADAFNKKGGIRHGNRTFIKGSNVYELICFTLGRPGKEPKHKLAFETLLREYGFGSEKVKGIKTKRDLATYKGPKPQPVVNERQDYSDEDTISWYSSCEDE